MLQIYSKGCEYVIRALSCMDQKECKHGFSISNICQKARIPVWFTRKIFQSLVKQGVFMSKHGPGGGYRFKKDPKKISLLTIITAVDGDALFKTCILGRPHCNSENPCSVHSSWGKTREKLISKFRSITIKDLTRKNIRLHSHIHPGNLS
ncbi:MAG: Rrf2 family transcriptional regulator, partial [Candidatus Omnitrophica bacterium]|nr:Rrf2 family transcriptional regulator [Candidatus Omnitrophota bacterium]